MSISKKIGSATAKLVAGSKTAPTKTGSFFSRVGNNLAEGYREVIPAKEKTS